MAKEMGLAWTPEPGKNSHLSLTLTQLQGGEALRDLSVRLSITDPTGLVTNRVAEVMSAPGMYHYGIDFQRHTPGAYRVRAAFERNGRVRSVEASIRVP